MRKLIKRNKWIRHTAVCLSTAMMLTSFNSALIYAENSSDEVFLEEMEDEELFQTETEPVEVNDEESEETIIINDAQEESEEEYVLDLSEEPETNVSPLYQTYSSNLEIAESNDGYISLSTADNKICYKYDENEKTLYFKRAAGITEPVDMPTTNTGGGSEWFQAIGWEKIATIENIVIEDGIRSIGYRNFRSDAWSGYESLTTVSLANSVTIINDEAFMKDDALESINLNKVQSVGPQAFYNAKSLKEIVFEAEQVDIGESAFAGCKKLVSVTAKNIGLSESSFSSCSKLNSFIFNGQLEAVPERAFYNTQLASFDFSKVKTIGDNAFRGTYLTKLNFGEEDITIGINAFQMCKKIVNICYPGTSEKWLEISKGSALPASITRSLHCKKDNPTAKAATCEESGIELEDATCAVCNESYSVAKEIPALGHKYADDYTVDKEATCTEEGEQSKHCTHEGCNSRDDIQVIPINKDNHDYVTEITAQPTCTKDGVRTLTCSRCKDVKTEVIPATGVHQWSDWKKTADATVFAAEQQERNCATCDKKETRTVGEKLAATATVSASSVTLKEKQSTGTVKVAGLANGDSITSWKSTNTKVFTVSGKADGTCKLTGVKKGTAKLEITLASGLKKTVTVKVQAKTVKTSKISGLAKKMTVKKGGKITLKPVITPATSQQKVTYSSANKRVATVSSKGVITAKKAGTTKITVKSGSKKVTVKVTVPKTKTTAIKVGEKVSVKKGKTYSLKAKTTPSNSDEKITYKTSNKKIATVSKSGKIKGVKKGTATITIKSGKIVKKVKVTVK